MIILFLSLIFFTIPLVGIGYGLRNLAVVQSLSGYLFNGVLMLTFTWGILAFFVPINLWVEIPFLLIGYIIFFYKKCYRQFVALQLNKTFYLLGVITLCSGTFAPFILDQFGYYVPTINWIKATGWVAGVANVEWVLGQMSFWHLLQAGFSNFGDVFLRFNTLFLLYFLLYVFEKKRFVLLLVFPIALFFTQSPAPDLPVVLLSLVFLSELKDGNRNYAALFLLTAFIFTIKPTMIWTPVLMVLILFWKKRFKVRKLIPGILLFFLFLIKNAVVSGYPLFPTSFLSLPVAWHPTAYQMVQSSQFALMKSYDMIYSYHQLISANLFQRIEWWLFLPGIKGKINLFLVLSWIVFFVFCFKKNSRLYWMIFASLLVKSSFIIAFSAQYRFFIDVLVVMYVLMLWDFQKAWKIYAPVVSVLILFLLSFPNLLGQISPSFRLSQYMRKVKIQQLLKPQRYSYQRFQTLKLGNVPFHVTQDYPFIFDTPVPGITNYNLQQYLKMNYAPQYITPQKGFYPKKLNQKTRGQIEEFLKLNKEK